MNWPENVLDDVMMLNFLPIRRFSFFSTGSILANLVFFWFEGDVFFLKFADSMVIGMLVWYWLLSLNVNENLSLVDFGFEYRLMPMQLR